MEWISGNVYIRPTTLAKAGDVTGGHTHNFDHTTIIFRGGVRVTATLPNGATVTRERTAPAHLLIRAEVKHEFVALTDDTLIWCVYSHRTPQGDVVQEYDGWADAYV